MPAGINPDPGLMHAFVKDELQLFQVGNIENELN
jgi:hypothetical protein